MSEFETPTPITINAHLAAGKFDVVAEQRTTTSVDVTPYDSSAGSREAAERTRVEMRGNTLVIEPLDGAGWLRRRSGRIRVNARVPLDSRLQLKIESADVHCHGRYSTATIHSASGEISVEDVTGEAVLNTASGDARFGRVGGHLRAHSASGDVIVGRVEETVGARTASGDLEFGDVGGAVNLKTASGEIRIGTAYRGSVKVHSASGDVRVGVAPGTGVWLDLSTVSGSTHSELSVADNAPGGATADLSISVRTMSGDITVQRSGAPSTATTNGLDGEPGKWFKR
jgi:DUF4097 and DUF4098 domain-containing protein YvlB